MPQFQIKSDGTIEGTQVIKDGVDLTEQNKVVSVSFNAHTTWDEIDVSYVIEEDYINEKGEKDGVERIAYSWQTGEWVRSAQNEESKPLSAPALGKSSDETEGQIGGKKIQDVTPKDDLKRIFKSGD